MNKNKKILIVSLSILFILLTVGVSFAFFLWVVVNGNDEVNPNDIAFANLSLKYNEEPITNTIESFEPGSSLSRTFYVENTGTGSASFSIHLVDVINTYNYKSYLVYTLTCTTIMTNTEEELGSCNGKGETIYPSEDTLIHAASNIERGTTQKYTLTVTYKEAGFNQSTDQEKIFEGKISLAKK